MKNFTIEFSVHGTCTQEVQILDDSYTPEQIIKALNAGELFTTTWHEDKETTYITNLNGDNVARINYSQIDGEYFDFINPDEE